MRHSCARALRRLQAGVSAVLLVLVGGAVVLVAGATSAKADTAPPDPTTPATVSADPLPTVQINGVVWSQVTVGNTVFVTGSFSSARPAGSASGSNETPRSNLLAYNITTGALITSFNHSLNAQGKAIAAAPDGSTVYVGGDFTTVDGVTHNHIAAFNAATGNLITTFNASVAAEVLALSATNSTVYVGGVFASAGGANRNRLAAFTSAGALTNWAPTADDNQVAALVVTPDQTRVIVGGKFTTLNGVPAYGLGAVDATTGATLPYAVNQAVQDSGDKAGITSLKTDGTNVYGTGFVFGPGGNLEGAFAADPDSGTIRWIEDCHGDSYDTAPVGGVLYLVSHEHFCGNIGDWPQTSPNWTYHRATAFTTAATGTIAHNSIGGYADWYGQPDPTQLDWYPTLAAGTYTGQSQAAWSATGNSSYISLGGEFPTVNGTAQQGLVRFAIKTIAPNKVGPVYSSSLTPSLVSLAGGTMRVSWTTTYDPDNEALTYKVVRDGNTANPIFTKTVNSKFWTLSQVGFTDTGLTPGSTHTYKVYVYDPFNNTTNGSTASGTVSSGSTTSQYSQDVINDGAGDYWRLGESSGTTGYDWAAYSDLTEGSTVGHGATGAITGDSNAASTFDGSSNGTAGTPTTITGPDTFTEEAWVNTTSTSGGKIVGFGDSQLGTSNNYDRHVYMDNAGHLIFGVYNNGVYTITTPGTYNDGQYHLIDASLSSAGMVLYVDGKRVGKNTSVTGGQPYAGYWRVGGDNLGGWSAQPSSNFFAGTIDDVAIYPTALSLAQVQKRYTDSGRTLNIPQPPTDAYGRAVYNDNPDLYWRLDDATGPTAADATPNGVTGNYSGGVTYQQPSTVTGPTGTGVGFDGNNGLLVSSQPVSNPTVYSEELWFKTTTTSGGKLIGFGDATSGNSSNYDRHVWMLNTGQLEFGTYTGQTNTITSPNSYNDGQWHHLVADQGGDGMHLYVDGQQVGTNPQTQAQSYTGYWRVGGDTTWGGSSSNYFAGTIDEVAVYSSELSQAQVTAHYAASPAGNAPPTAAFTSSCTQLACSFDGSASADPDGTVASYAWDFGDGTTATGATPTHTYAAGTYTVTLTVTDNKGATGTVTHQVTATAPPVNQAPTAAFTPTCTNLGCSFDGTASADPDGTVASYAWDFGDGTTATGATPTHTYAADGTYTVGLTVTDNQGATGTVSHTVTVTSPPANQPPVAAFTPTCTHLACTFDGSASSDPDGTIASYAWDFGDGTTATGATSAHTYATAGTYTVSLAVTDNVGATTTVTHSVTVTAAPADQPPVAAFSANCPALGCTFDGTASADPDGTIASYAWSFGDGTTGTGATPSHTYAAAGDYPVSLTVTDNQGATGVVTHTVSPRPAANPSTAPYATDTFNRTVASGLGSADTGGAWTTSGGTGPRSVAPGVASFTLGATSAQTGGYLGSVSKTDTETDATVTTDKVGTGNGVYLYVIGRRVSTNNEYRARIRLTNTNAVALALTYLPNSGTETVLKGEQTLTGVTYTPGMLLKVRFQVVGTNPTTLRLKVWPSSQTEPTSWQLTTTDTTAALQAPGSVGVTNFLSGSSTNAPVVAKLSAFGAGPTAAAPTASFTTSATGLAVAVDGSGSTDPNNAISSYTWSWGDGTVTNGATSTHTFTAAGTYRITLTVTNTFGFTDVTTRTVTVTP